MCRPSTSAQMDMFPDAIPTPSVADAGTPAQASQPTEGVEACGKRDRHNSEMPRPQAAKQPSRGRNQQRPVRRTRVAVAKATVMSPEARRAADERNRRMIEEYIAQGKVTKCPPRWAMGAVNMSMFGTDV